MDRDDTLKSFQEWLDDLNRDAEHPIIIRDYDGLGRKHLDQSLHSMPMTEHEFQRRLTRCSFNIRPQPFRTGYWGLRHRAHCS